MAWELLAMWGIVIVTVVWFIRDERRLRAEAELQRAARYYAHAPKYRHVSTEPAEQPAPQRRTGGLTREQRAFIAAFTAPKAQDVPAGSEPVQAFVVASDAAEQWTPSFSPTFRASAPD